MEIYISNFLGVEEVTIPLGRTPVCVTGPNASGKTSLATAIAAILSRDYNPLSLGPTRRPYVRDTADDGEVVLRGSDGQEYRRWRLLEKGIRVLPGGPDDVSRHVLGLTHFITGPSKYRTDAWESCFLPGSKELVSMVGDELKKQLSRAAVIDEVLRMLRTKKWSECEAIFKHKATEAKREWATITGEAWGAKKADRWNPPGWRSALDNVTPTEAHSTLEDAREALRLLQQVQAVKESDVQRAQQVAAEVPNLEKEVAALTDEHSSAADELSGVRDELSALRDRGLAKAEELKRHDEAQPVREETTPCPACGEGLVIGPNRSLTRARDESAFNAQLQAWQMGRDRIDEDLSSMRAASVDLQRKRLQPAQRAESMARAKLNDAQSRLAAARREAKLSDATPATTDDQRKASEAEQRVDDAKACLDLVNTKVQAQNAHLNAVNYGHIAYALGPRGIRARAMKARMDKLAEVLHEVEGTVQWPRVELDAAYTVMIAGRPGQVSSASERWRAEFMLQCAIAIVLNQPYVIADGADILDSTGRVQFVGLCDWLAQEYHVFTIVCATGSIGELPAAWRKVDVIDGRSTVDAG